MPPHTALDIRPSSPASPGFAGRDRVLLYTRGMNLSPTQGVALALRSMRRAGEYAPAPKVMAELFLTFQENEVPLAITTEDGIPFVSAPPMNRRTMIAEDMIQLSLSGALKKLLASLLKGIRGKEGK